MHHAMSLTSTSSLNRVLLCWKGMLYLLCANGLYVQKRCWDFLYVLAGGGITCARLPCGRP